MSNSIRFTVDATPMGAPRMTQRDRWAKRDCVTRYWAFKDAIRKAIGDQLAGVSANDVLSLSWTAYFSPPASWSKKKREEAMGKLHRSKPDRDNLDKGVMDSLFEQDAGIATGVIAKRWGEPPRIEVEICIGEEK